MANMDFESQSLTELIEIEKKISQTITKRFKRHMALVFSDIVGSTDYFQRYGDKEGRGLQQKHYDLLNIVLAQYKGQLIDTAGDGAFFCFEHAQAAAEATIELQNQVCKENLKETKERRLTLRIGIHWGPVLMDKKVVTGDSVNLAARVAGQADEEMIAITKETSLELMSELRLICKPFKSASLKGISEPVELLVLPWRNEELFPTCVKIKESGEEIDLPEKDLISFGRLSKHGDETANDIVLRLDNEEETRQISRWHFQLRRGIDGFHLKSLSKKPTEVDGQEIAEDEEKTIKIGSVVRISDVMTLTFYKRADAGANETIGEESTMMGDLPSQD